MDLENVACPLCGSRRHRLVFTRPDHTHKVGEEKFKVVKCRDCGFVFVNPRPTEQGIHEYYTDEFYAVHLKPGELLRESAAKNQAKLKFIRDLAPGRLLDIGCQKGEFLYEARQLGWDVHGVEFSTKPPNVFDLPIHYGGLEDFPCPDASFDVVTVWAVLEHVHDPLKMMAHVNRLLKPGGRACILVPNFNSIPGRFLRHDDIPRHLLMFTPSTFKKMAGKCGFKPLSFVFGDDVFSGSTRGFLNYAYKLIRGEKLEDIVAQNREAGRWDEFSNFVNGRKSDFMLKIDRLDIRLSPYLDRLVNLLHLGFIMTVVLEKNSDLPHTPAEKQNA